MEAVRGAAPRLRHAEIAGSGAFTGSLVLVLATERKTPLREAASSAPGRTQKTESRSKVARRRAVVGGAAAVVLIGGVGFLATRGGDGILTGIIGGSDRPVPEFAFVLKGTDYEPTEIGGDKAAQQSTAKSTADEVRTTLDTLYSTAYVNPDTWGDTGEIEDLFTKDAQGRLETDVNVLTLGANAGDTYDFVQPLKSQTSVQVLTDAKGGALRAYAKVTFFATTELKDGTFTKIASTGSFFLVSQDGAWMIEGYRVQRGEKAYTPPTPTPTPTDAATPTEASS